MHLRKRRTATLAGGIILGLFVSSTALAGISPENVIVVVNADSHDSRTIANHYIDFRDIPTSNVILLRDVPQGVITTLAEFRTKILTPLITEIDARKLSGQSRVIAYSADFPTAVNIAEHYDKVEDPTIKQIQKPTASLTGLTYFYRMVLSDNPIYLRLNANLYARDVFQRNFENPFLGEREKQFAEAKQELDLGNAAEAAKEFDALFATAPSLSAVAIVAAEAYAKAKQNEDALRMLKLAIQSGWWSGTYIKESEALEPLLDDPQIKGAIDYMSDAAIAEQGPIGFSASYGWTNTGERVPIAEGGVSYLASCMLAVTGPRGSRIGQAVEYLKRASEADRTFPKGEFRFALSSDVRTTTRLPKIPSALVYLAEDGHKCDIIREVIPSDPGDVAGLMLGTADYDLRARRWNFVPGAIADNLTSVSAAFEHDSQTKMTELLHAGAAMTSGSVAEPFAIPAKFPQPMMYAYYADGVTAIEAFHLSIHSPYQTLIVGDPLCQPYAKAPNEWIDIEVSRTTPRVIQFQRKPTNLSVPTGVSRLIDIYVEGKLIKQSPPVAAIRMNLPPNISGVIEVRAVLIAIGAQETRLWFSEEFDLAGAAETPVAKVTKSRGAKGDEPDAKQMTFSLQCKNADSVELWCLDSRLGSVDGEAGSVTIDTKPLGDGPLRFRAVATFGETKIRGRQLIDRGTVIE